MSHKKQKPSGESSPYWDFMFAHQTPDASGLLREPIEGNADGISEEYAHRYMAINSDRELKLIVLKKVLSSLSPQQQKLLLLCAEKKDIREASLTMGISESTAHTFLRRARNKILRAYEKHKILLEKENER